MSKDNGGPAFPQINHWDNDRMRMGDSGMTLRDYFAAKAMQGLLAQSEGSAPTSDLAFGAKYAYQMADAMLAERNK